MGQTQDHPPRMEGNLRKPFLIHVTNRFLKLTQLSHWSAKIKNKNNGIKEEEELGKSLGTFLRTFGAQKE